MVRMMIDGHHNHYGLIMMMIIQAWIMSGFRHSHEKRVQDDEDDRRFPLVQRQR